MQYSCQQLFLPTLSAQAAYRATDAVRQVSITYLAKRLLQKMVSPINTPHTPLEGGLRGVFHGEINTDRFIFLKKAKLLQNIKWI